jgi:hypothetical protein
MGNSIALLLLLMGLLSGCFDDSKAVAERERQRADKAEQALRAAQSSRAAWQTLAALACVSGVVLLFVGSALGSSARKDAEEKTSGAND